MSAFILCPSPPLWLTCFLLEMLITQRERLYVQPPPECSEISGHPKSSVTFHPKNSRTLKHRPLHRRWWLSMGIMLYPGLKMIISWEPNWSPSNTHTSDHLVVPAKKKSNLNTKRAPWAGNVAQWERVPTA